MKKIVKKIVALAAVTALTLTTFTGCADTTIDHSKVVATVGKKEITAGFANFYVRYEQANGSTISMYEAQLGESVWEMQLSDGYTYEDSIKDMIMDNIHSMMVIAAHAEDYKVTISDEELAEIQTTAKAFVKANDKEVLEKVSGTEENVVEYLKILLLNKKMEEAMVADVDTVVKEEDAAQKRMRYMEYLTTTTLDDGSTMEMSADEKADAKKKAEEFLAGAKANGSMEAYAKEKNATTKTLAFNKESKDLDEAVIKAADALGEKAFSEVIEAKNGYYVVQLESAFDKEATEAKKESIVETRKAEQYEKLLTEWKKADDIKVEEDVWEEISLADLGVTAKKTEDKKTEDKKTEDKKTEE